MGAGERFKKALGFGPRNITGPGPARVRDASGKVLEVGDEVLVITNKMILRVASVERVLHPGAPPNMLMLTLVCRMGVGVPCDQAVEDVYFTRHAAAIKDGFLAGLGAEAPPPPDDENPPAGPIDPGPSKIILP